MTITPEITAFRWGYGLPLPATAPRDPAAMLDLLSGPDHAGTPRAMPGMAEIVQLLDAVRLNKKQSRTDMVIREKVKGIEGALNGAMYGGIVATYARAIDSPDGLRERLVQFWADHFTTTTRSQYPSLYPLVQVEDAIRPHLTGRFADLLRAAVLHPAMITYLDQWRSAGPNSVRGLRRGEGLNENLARELLELHTLGAEAAYKQADVRQTAELLTGLSFTIKGGLGEHFDPDRVEPGPEWVLGQKYGGQGLEPIHALLDDLAQRPETARHIARKLIVHFITDDPDPGDVAAVERAFTDSGGDLMAVYAVLLARPSAWEPPGAKARQPFDFVAASFRALGVTGADLAALDIKSQGRFLLDPVGFMGQPFKNPRGPDGAPEEAAAWITPQGLTSRLNFAILLQRGRRSMGLVVDDPVGLAMTCLGSRASPELLAAVAGVEDKVEAAALVLISPAFNRR